MIGSLILAVTLCTASHEGVDITLSSGNEVVDPGRSVFIDLKIVSPKDVEVLPPDLRSRVRGFTLAEDFAIEPYVNDSGLRVSEVRWRLVPEPCAKTYKIAPFAVKTKNGESFVAGPVYFKNPPEREKVAGEMIIDPKKDLPPLSWKLVGYCALILTGSLTLTAVIWMLVKYLARRVKEHRMSNKWWKASSTTDAKEYSAIAFFAGRKIASELNVPVGIICTPYGGTRIEAWMPAERVRTFKPDEYKEASELSESAAKKSAPGLLYNGMVHPIQNYTIRGWAWYQGESNRDNSFAYARLQQAMVDEWRKAKGDTEAQIPFYYVQISGTGKNTDTYGADLIQAQWDALKLIPNSGIVTSSDCGDQVQGVHYPNKKTPGERLGNLILHDVYGRTDLKVAPPMVESVSYEGGKATVSFSNGEGLHATGSTIPYVQLVDAAGKLHTATATIVNGKMEVTCASVAEAKGVRYCYMSWHLSTVFNDAGIPLAPFKHTK